MGEKVRVVSRRRMEGRVPTVQRQNADVFFEPKVLTAKGKEQEPHPSSIPSFYTGRRGASKVALYLAPFRVWPGTNSVPSCAQPTLLVSMFLPLHDTIPNSGPCIPYLHHKALGAESRPCVATTRLGLTRLPFPSEL